MKSWPVELLRRYLLDGVKKLKRILDKVAYVLFENWRGYPQNTSSEYQLFNIIISTRSPAFGQRA